jgi:transposase-like protein
MSEKTSELKTRLIKGQKREGRCVYDEGAKQELVDACLKPSVSVARMALQYGVNADLLRTWVTQHQRRSSEPHETSRNE